MKVCWWTIYPTAHQAALLEGLRERGLDVEVCYFRRRYGKGRLRLGWRDPELQAWEHDVRTITAARRTIADFDERVQMVPSFSDGISWRLILWCVLKRRRWFVLSEGTRGRWMTRPIFRLFCRLADRFALHLFAEGGPDTVRQFVAGGVRREKVTQFCYATREPPADIPRDAGGTVFVFAGEFCARKAVDVIVRAWAQVHAEFTSAKLIMAGDGGATVVGDGIEYAGALPQERVYEVICRGDVMLLPSRYDAWGAALAEGGLAGLAMVGSDRTGSARLLVRDGENGYNVRAGDVDDLVRVMRIYAADRSLARKHGAAARAAAAQTTGAALSAKMMEVLKR